MRVQHEDAIGHAQRQCAATAALPITTLTTGVGSPGHRLQVLRERLRDPPPLCLVSG